MHKTGLRLFFYEVANSLGLASKQDLEAARDAHLKQLNSMRPDCDHHRDVYTEGRGSYRECISDFSASYPRASLWK